jgi:hypothetical protein
MIGGGSMDNTVRRICGADAYRPYGMAEMALA